MPQKAIKTLKNITNKYRNVSPYSSLANIDLTVSETDLLILTKKSELEKNQIINNTIYKLKKYSKHNNQEVIAKSSIEQSRLLMKSKSSNFLNALNLLDSVIANESLNCSNKSEAIMEKANIYNKIGEKENVYALYIEIISKFCEEKKMGGFIRK